VGGAHESMGEMRKAYKILDG